MIETTNHVVKQNQNSQIFSSLENPKTLDVFTDLNLYLCARKQQVEKGVLSKFSHDKQLLEDAFPKLLNELIGDIDNKRSLVQDLVERHIYTLSPLRKKQVSSHKRALKKIMKKFPFLFYFFWGVQRQGLTLQPTLSQNLHCSTSCP